jgi:hypothetical protein
MATISFSTELVKDIMTSLTDLSTPPEGLTGVTYQTDNSATNAVVDWSNSASGGSLFSYVYNGGYYTNGWYYQRYATGVVSFRNSSGITLTSYNCSDLTRAIDSDGYCVLSNFPPKIPSVAGTITDIYFQHQSGQTTKTITLSVGPVGGQSDVQFDDRVLVTNQPWRLDGSIKFRIPISYTFST